MTIKYETVNDIIAERETLRAAVGVKFPLRPVDRVPSSQYYLLTVRDAPDTSRR